MIIIGLISFPGNSNKYIYAQEIQEIPKEKLISQIVYTGLERWHYSGKRIDDKFSEQAFLDFLHLLDPSKRFLLKSDIDILHKYKDKIDDELEAGETDIMDLGMQLLDERIGQVMSFYKELLAKPFDFTRDEYLETDPDNIDYCANLDELKEYWRKTLKYRVLLRYITFINSNKKEKEIAATKKGDEKNTKPEKSNEEMEEEARKSVEKSFKNFFNRLRQTNKEDSLSRYLNSLVQVYDPHTSYFLPIDKETFDMQMSGSFEGIGALLQNEDEYVKVSSIVPGGPSWRGRELQAGDIILKVAQGDEEPVDIIGMRTTEAVKLIRGKKGTLVRLTVKKPDGQIVEIPIVRDVVILEDTFARSAILVKKETGQRMGYIDLPGFYNDFNNEDGRNSTDDVKAEIDKLKQKKIDGIILDLRSNTGGALLDAVRMSGLFIPKGPIVQVKDKRGHINSLKDTDPSVEYSGPLVVLVNRLSASASEILAAALQDYNRAVIVGGKHSFGKGTVQAMLNLDKFLTAATQKKKKEKYDSFGAMTITIQKFYRINGKSIQLRGVTPDIVLPDTSDFLEIGERHLDHSLAWDAVEATEYEKWQPQSLVSPLLIEHSRKRVQESPGFVELREYIRRLEQMREKTRQSLLLSKAMKLQEEIKKEREKLEESQVPLPDMEVIPSAPLSKKESASLEKIEKEKQEQWFEVLSKDIYLGEAIDIINDMVELNKN